MTAPLPDVVLGQKGHTTIHNDDRHRLNAFLDFLGSVDLNDDLVASVQEQMFSQPGGTIPIMSVEQYDTGSDADNFQAAFDDGAASSGLRYLRLKPNGVYGLGTTTVNYDQSKGDLVIDATGATINYAGTDWAFFCNNSAQAAGGGRVVVLNGTWNAPNAQHFWFLQDCRRYRFVGNAVNTPNGSHFYMFNKLVWSERNWFIDIDDRGCQTVIETNRDVFSPTGPAVTITASNNAITFQNPHNRVAGDPATFTNIVGAAPLVQGQTYYLHQVLDPLSFTLTLDPTTDDTYGDVLDITSDGTARSLDDPQSSFARTMIRNLSLQGGKAGFCKIKLAPGTGMYGSEIGVNVFGNINDGVGIWELNGGLSHSIIGPWDVEAGGSSTAFIFRVGVLTGQKPLRRGPFGSHVLAEYDLSPPAPYTAGAPSNSTRTWENTITDGMRVTHSRKFDGIDQAGRIAVPSASLANPTWYVTQSSPGGIFPFTRFGDAVLRATPGRGLGLFVDGGGLMVDAAGGAPKLGFFDKAIAPVLKPSVVTTTDLFAALDQLGLITNNSSGGGGGAGAGVVPGQLIALTTYKQSVAQSQTPPAVTPAATNVMSDLSAAAIISGWTGAAANMFDCTFQGPPSGLIDIEMMVPLSASASAAAVRLSLFDMGTGASVTNSTAVTAGGTAVTRGVYKQQFSVTPGQTYTWRPQWCVGVNTQSATVQAGGANGSIRVAALVSI